jgi:hypothetical protein
MSLIVGIALAIAAVIALISGNVLGMAAANVWTEVLWGGSGAILLFNSAAPRRRKTVVDERAPVQARPRSEPAPSATALALGWSRSPSALVVSRAGRER